MERLHCIRIVLDPNKDFEDHHVTVHPGHCYLRQGDRVCFAADAAIADSVLFCPHFMALFEDADNPFVALNKEGISDAFVVKAKPPEGMVREKFEYAVYVKSEKAFAVGGSSPSMIVEV